MSEVSLTRGIAIFPVCLVGTRTRSRRPCVPNDFGSEDSLSPPSAVARRRPVEGRRQVFRIG
jgi:hypothetical protein